MLAKRKFKGSSVEEVVSEIFDGTFDLSLGLWSVGITQSYNNTIIFGEIHEFPIEC